MIYKEFWLLFGRGYKGFKAAAVILLLTILVALFEGFNIGLLVPLLEGLEGRPQESSHWITRAFAKIFETFGIEMNLESILIALAVMVAIVSVLKYLKTILATKTDVGFIIWMRSKIMENYLKSDISYFHRTEIGSLNNTLITQVDHASGTFFSMTEIVASIGITLAYLVAALFISPSLTGIALATMLVVTLVMQYFINKARGIGTQLVDAHGVMQAGAIDTLSGIHVVKSFLLENNRIDDFTQRIKRVGRLNYDVDINRGQAAIVQEISLFALIGGIVFVAVKIIGLDLAVTVALLFVLYRMAPKINNLNSIRQGLAVSMAALHHVKETMDSTESSSIISGDKHFQRLEQEIILKNVCFAYSSGTNVLNNADLTIEQGKMTALVGSSGAGKSTLIDLVLRFYDPTSGRLIIDGVDLKELDLGSWRKSIGIVSQDVFLFNNTIGMNIKLGSGNSDVSHEELISAAKLAYAHDFITGLPHGYDTMVGDRGWNLSGGQRQRVSLARAILRKPDILILDEATSSLDSESENLIQEYIRSIRGQLTILVVAHRMSTIQGADKIAVLEEGRIVEEGDWNDLLAKAGTFANYHRLQYGD